MYGRKADGNILILALDLACVAASLGIGFGARYGRLYGVRGHWDMVWMLVLFLVAYTALALLLDFHRHFFRRGAVDELRQVLKGQLLLYLAMLAILYAMHRSDDLSRMVSAYFLVLNTALTYAARLLFRQLMLKGYRRSRYSSRLLLVAGMADAEGAIGDILRYNEWFRQLSGVALVDDPGLDLVAGIPVVADGRTLLDYAVHNGVDEVFITGKGLSDRGRLEEWVRQLGQMGITVNVDISAFDLDYGGRKTLGRVGKYATVAFARNLFSAGQLAAKRAMDIAGGLVGMALLGAAALFVAPAIKLDSPGPVLFKQTRVGRNGRKFTFYKFRSMYVDAEQRKQELMASNEVEGLMFKMKDDPRVTRVGRFLRRTSIDEFPQFWNVLRGDMSLVGTRPPTVDEFERYEASHRCRLSMTPGLTGMWQVSGRSDISDFEEVVRLDMEYIDNWSIWKDVKILLMTVRAVATGKGSR